MWRVACGVLHVACCVWRVACGVLCVACCVCCVACVVLRVLCCVEFLVWHCAFHVLHVACCMLRVACCVLRMRVTNGLAIKRPMNIGVIIINSLLDHLLSIPTVKVSHKGFFIGGFLFICKY
jgi:hypothetical protein